MMMKKYCFMNTTHVRQSFLEIFMSKWLITCYPIPPKAWEDEKEVN